MKRLLTLLLLTASFAVSAQDVSVKKDVIYKDDVPYAKIQKSGAILHTFSVSTLEGEEILVAQPQGDGRIYNIVFMASGAKSAMQGGFNFSKKLAAELVASNLIKDGRLNPAGERRFLLLHPAEGGAGSGTGGQMAATQNDESEPLPARNSHMPIMTNGGKVSQGGTTLGTYKVSQGAERGSIYRVFTFYSPGGRLVAEARMDGVGATEARIVTAKNNRTTAIPIEHSNPVGAAQEIAKWLVGQLYL